MPCRLLAILTIFAGLIVCVEADSGLALFVCSAAGSSSKGCVVKPGRLHCRSTTLPSQFLCNERRVHAHVHIKTHTKTESLSPEDIPALLPKPVRLISPSNKPVPNAKPELIVASFSKIFSAQIPTIHPDCEMTAENLRQRIENEARLETINRLEEALGYNDKCIRDLQVSLLEKLMRRRQQKVQTQPHELNAPPATTVTAYNAQGEIEKLRSTILLFSR